LIISKSKSKKISKTLEQNDIKINRKLIKRKIRNEISFVLLNNKIELFLTENKIIYKEILNKQIKHCNLLF
jgi:hypothetical protein